MKYSLNHRIRIVVALPVLLLALTGCGGGPPAETNENQKATEKDAKAKIMNAYRNDPTLRKPGPDGNSNSTGSGSSAGPVPGQGGMSAGPVPGAGR